jgi:hypothetical protein
MSDEESVSSLQELLDKLEESTEGEDRICIEQVHKAAGRRSFGPVLLIPGLIAASPLSGIPGSPSVVGIMVLLISGQMLIGRSEFWLPGFVLKRSISQSRFEKALRVLRPVARFVDKLIKPRMRWFVNGIATYMIAVVCLLLALTAPILEALPFAITGVGAAVTAFGLALIGDDGLIALIALIICIATAVIVINAFM